MGRIKGGGVRVLAGAKEGVLKRTREGGLLLEGEATIVWIHLQGNEPSQGDPPRAMWTTSHWATAAVQVVVHHQVIGRLVMMSLTGLVIRKDMKTGSTEVCPRHISVASAVEQSPICDERSPGHPCGSLEDAPPPLDAQGHPYGGQGHP